MRNSDLAWWSDRFRGAESDWFSSDRWHFPDDWFPDRSAAGGSVEIPDRGSDILGGGAAGSPASGIIAVDLVHDIEMPETWAALTKTGTGGSDTLVGTSGMDTLKGKGGDDVLDGGADRDKLIGGNGDDRLEGGSGNDTLSGNAGDDTLIGGAGNDVLRGQIGNDVLRGQIGNDVFVMEQNGGNDSVLDFVRFEDKIDVSSLGIAGLSGLQNAISVFSNKVEIELGGSKFTLTDFSGPLGSESFIFADGGPPPVNPPPVNSPTTGAKGDFDITIV